jgi:predicted transglutaminase-like protease
MTSFGSHGHVSDIALTQLIMHHLSATTDVAVVKQIHGTSFVGDVIAV